MDNLELLEADSYKVNMKMIEVFIEKTYGVLS